MKKYPSIDQNYWVKIFVHYNMYTKVHKVKINVVYNFPSTKFLFNTIRYYTNIFFYDIQAPQPYRDILSLHCPGTPFWISREEYILFGNHQLAQSSGDVGE